MNAAIKPNDLVWFPSKTGGLSKAVVISTHGPVTRISHFDGKNNVTLDVKTAELSPWADGEPPHITVAMQIRCVDREIAMRRSVYATRVAARSMTQDAADYQIAAMCAVKATLESAGKAEDQDA